MSNINDSTPFVPLYKKTYYIHKTIIRNDMDSLKHILSDGRRDTINDLDYSGRTPFHVALQQANPKALYLMLYYPLLHPSKLFATLDWVSLLDSISLEPKDTQNKSEAGGDQVQKKDATGLEFLNESKQTKISKSGSSESLGYNNIASVGRTLLAHWEKNPADYFNTCLSLDEKSQVNGCGVKEVEHLYEEHYKFLIGEAHNLENAAKTYTMKYLRLYYPSYFKTQLRESSIITRSDSTSSLASTDHAVDKQPYTTERTEPNSQEDNSTASNETIHANQNLDNLLNRDKSAMDRMAGKIVTQTLDKLKKGLIEVGTVDLITTFDKTSPLHLLFSNVYISTYRPNMLKCFRILIYYFNKSDEFYNLYNSIDYTLYFNSSSINKCLDLYNSSSKLKRNRPKNHEAQDTSIKKHKEDEMPETTGNGSDTCARKSLEDESNFSKRELESDLVNPKRPKTDLKVANFPNLTVCADASEMAQKKDKRSCTLLNLDRTQTQVKNDHAYTLFDPCDQRSFALHNMILNSLTWSHPNVSWDTFVKRPDFSRSTILHRVCNLKDHTLIKIVLGCGFSPIVVNESGDMPVHLSVDARDPQGFLTILHCTLKELFYSRFNPRDYDLEVFINESPTSGQAVLGVPPEGEERVNHRLSNEFYNMYMGHMCVTFFKIHENVNDKFYKLIDHAKFRGLLSLMDQQTSTLLFDEFLMLFEQLVYRCIKAWAWECLIALLSYNAVLTYHLVSNPCFMHRFINFSTMNKNGEEFIAIMEFIMTNVIFDGFNSKDSSNNSDKNQVTSDQSKAQKKDQFRGCGIPHSGLRSFASPQSLKPLGSYSTPCFTQDIILSSLIKNYKSSSRSYDTSLKTWIITHPTCLHHLATPEPTDAPNKRHRLIVTYPENPTRLEVIISNDNGILRSDTLDNVKLVHSPPPASLADILRVHDWGYIDKLLEQVQFAQKRWVTHPYWPVLADGDTPVTPHSWSAALYAAGSVISAVDAVCTNMCKNAFCAVRPPGHHLGTWGGAQYSNLEDEDFAAGSQGFCLINNVAIGAAYAKYTYANKGIRKIAIIDFDVHHGNGTEQVVRNIGPKNVKVASASSDSGATSQPQQETIHKKWFGWRDEKDRDDILFASIHAYDGIFYPGTGQQCTLYQKENSPNVINVAVPQGTSSAEFRALFETKICPYVYHFRPDLIFISAGFDGHYRDSVSYGFTRYTEKDFNYVTERLVTIANSVCEGRVVSVLEGGYNTKLNTLSPFARSVLEHVTALCNTRRDTTYPYMFGENSINYLLSPVIKTISIKTDEATQGVTSHNEEILSALNYRLNSLTTNGSQSSSGVVAEGQKTQVLVRRKNSDEIFKAYKIRTKAEMLISKVYSIKMCYCKHPRLTKLDKSQMCCRSIVEMSGNQFLSFYSKYFYSLFAMTTSMATQPSFFVKATNSTVGVCAVSTRDSGFWVTSGRVPVEAIADLKGTEPNLSSNTREKTTQTNNGNGLDISGKANNNSDQTALSGSSDNVKSPLTHTSGAETNLTDDHVKQESSNSDSSKSNNGNTTSKSNGSRSGDSVSKANNSNSSNGNNDNSTNNATKASSNNISSIPRTTNTNNTNGNGGNEANVVDDGNDRSLREQESSELNKASPENQSANNGNGNGGRSGESRPIGNNSTNSNSSIDATVKSSSSNSYNNGSGSRNSAVKGGNVIGGGHDSNITNTIPNSGTSGNSTNNGNTGTAGDGNNGSNNRNGTTNISSASGDTAVTATNSAAATIIINGNASATANGKSILNVKTNDNNTTGSGNDGVVEHKIVIRNPFDSAHETASSEDRVGSGEDIDDIVTRLKVMRDVNESNNLITSNPWLANVKLRALEQNYQVALKLDNFYTKYEHLFKRTCHIHAKI